MKMTPQQYCLRWKHHHTNVQNMFAQLLEKERFCDVTLYCSPNFASQVPNKDTVEPQNIRGVSLRAHRVVLAACSELLGALLGAHDALGEPVLVIDGAEPKHLRALLDYMYTGEMSVHHSQLASLLKTAEELRIKGLTDIRWNNKDEPPDGQSGGIITTTEKCQPVPKTPEPKILEAREPRTTDPKSCDRDPKLYERNVHIYDREPRIFEPDPKLLEPRLGEREKEPQIEPMLVSEQLCSELRAFMKREEGDDGKHDKFAVNGGPPPLIKLPSKDKSSPIKRENSDTDTPSPKRQRAASVMDNTDDDTRSQKSERDDWQHGNLDISAERVVNWGMGGRAGGSWARDDDDDEWADAPADIGSFLDTRLRVDGDNSADDDSNDSSSLPSAPMTLPTPTAAELLLHTPSKSSPASSCKSGPVDPRFMDVVKLNDYLQHGRRPQFWEENYVRRVMEAVRLKELEMKQAAEILGVSYGTLYGRYRDVYGCINRPYRTARDFWQAKGPSEVLERLQRGEVSLESASQALGVTPNILAAHVADFGPSVEKGRTATLVLPEVQPDPFYAEFEPIPIEIDPSLKMKPGGRGLYPPASQVKPRFKTMPQTDKAPRKTLLSTGEEDDIPASVITTHEGKTTCTTTTGNAAGTGKWPTIRVAQLDTLRGSPPAADPSLLMRTRPDLTIVAAKRTEKKDDENA